MVLQKTRKKTLILKSSCPKTKRRNTQNTFTKCLKNKHIGKMGNIILRGGAKNNENKFTTTNLVKAGVKSLFFSDTQYKVTKYTRNIVEYTKKLNTTKIDIQKNMSNMLVNDKFLYNIDNMQNKFLKPLIDVINTLGRKTSLVEQDKKKFNKSILYINSFIRKNKNPSCNVQLFEK